MPAVSSSAIVAALIQPDTNLDEVVAEQGVERTALSLLDALAEVPDPRAARGVRHGVLAVLLLSACAVLSGARSFVAIAEYAHDTGRAVLDALGIGTGTGGAPHESTIRRLLQRLDPAAVETALSRWASAQVAGRVPEVGVPARELRRVWALDGKTVRGAGDADGAQPHLVSVLDQATGAVLAQRQVDARSGELSAVPDLLAGLDLHDVLITADALCRRRHNASYEDMPVMPTCRPAALLEAVPGR
ncbi:ISAs1 family transposase [Pseudonocardia saturnea]